MNQTTPSDDVGESPTPAESATPSESRCSACAPLDEQCLPCAIAQLRRDRGDSTPAESRERVAAHTPGPWEMWTSCSFRRIGSASGEVLCGITQRSDGHPDLLFPNGGYEGPDARLILAAPELLEACIAARSWLAGWASADPYIDILEAAIARATTSPIQEPAI